MLERIWNGFNAAGKELWPGFDANGGIGKLVSTHINPAVGDAWVSGNIRGGKVDGIVGVGVKDVFPVFLHGCTGVDAGGG